MGEIHSEKEREREIKQRVRERDKRPLAARRAYPSRGRLAPAPARTGRARAAAREKREEKAARMRAEEEVHPEIKFNNEACVWAEAEPLIFSRQQYRRRGSAADSLALSG